MSAPLPKRFPLALTEVVNANGGRTRTGTARAVPPPATRATLTRPAERPPATLTRPAERPPATLTRPAERTSATLTRTNERPPATPVKPARLSERIAVTAPGKIALTSDRVRLRMVDRLRAGGVSDERILAALASIPRHGFVDAGLATKAYDDDALPIGHHQTISKPSVIARMLELVTAGRALERVLEIGTGCGYQAAVLSQIATEVYSIERIRPMFERAKSNLRPLRAPNIRLHYGDGRLGLPVAAPFDAIVIAAAGLEVPQALLGQLRIGGRLIAPVGAEQQVLTLIERVAPAQWREQRLDSVFFVPLKSGVI